MRRWQWPVVLASGLLLAACGDGGESESPSSSAASTTVEVTTTSTVAVGTWSRPCTEYVRGTPSVPVIDEAALDAFGPLEVEPGLTIELPDVMISNGWSQLVPSMARIDGGVMVSGTAATVGSGYNPPEASIVLAVDHDGSVRWVRCLDSTVSVQAYTDELGLIVVYPDPSDRGTKEYLPVDLVDGSIGAAVQAPPTPEVPDLSAGVNPWESSDGHFQFLDASGNVVWEDPTLGDAMHEGTYWSSRDGVTIISGIALPSGGENLVGLTRGYQTTDGRVLWEHPSLHVIGPHDNGYILVHSVDINMVDSSAAVWLMLDARTGEAIPGQEWTEFNTFATGCCDDRLIITFADGGVVLHSDGDLEHPTTIRVYYPIDAGVTPHTVVLP